MKSHVLLFVLALGFAGCGKDLMTSPTAAMPAAPQPAPIAQSTTVAVLSQATGQTTLVTLSASDPQPPSCAWRDKVIALHISLGGRKNDIVTLANLHDVFIQDTGSGLGYRLIDYPRPWCQ